jgi:6-pyruvoyltetrahydropterin/6-carboxytetrahydropterin synthase
VVGHESHCRNLHGHNYLFTFYVEAKDGELDAVGRVLDFTSIKNSLCAWLEENWDHKFMVWEEDTAIHELMQTTMGRAHLTESLVWVPFNPTAENIAKHLVLVVGPRALAKTNVTLVRVDVGETRKCSATFCLR